MTEFRPMTPEHGKVFYNGEQIGRYKNFNYQKKIEIEVNYHSFEVEYKDKKRIPRLTELVYIKQQHAIRRRLIKNHKLRNSIYNTKQPFTYG